LRLWDVTSANLVDRFITNSNYVAKRIRRCYGREADVVFGPASIEGFVDRPRAPDRENGFYLFLGQVTGYKRADLAIEACVQSGRRLVVAGAGARTKDKQRYAKTGLVTWTGRLSDEEVAGYYSRARALIFPGIEDLGLVPIEANAAGCPVIAFAKGGALDTVLDGVTGLFFHEQTTGSLIAALDRFEAEESRFAKRAPFTAHVRQFSKAAFQARVAKVINERRRV
jgi:glycosyltransferase involved in cell wall biosynthesis